MEKPVPDITPAPVRPQPIDTAPTGDGWILAQVPSLAAANTRTAPWTIATRCDGGWCDDFGYSLTPTAWVPLPDPQPSPTGWRPATGVIKVVPIVGGSIPWAKWLIIIMIAEGVEDLTREADVAATREEALECAYKLGSRLGLPVIEPESPLSAVRLAYSGVPITKDRK